MERGYGGSKFLRVIGVFLQTGEGAIEFLRRYAVLVSCGLKIGQELPSPRIVEHVMEKCISRYRVPTRPVGGGI